MHLDNSLGPGSGAAGVKDLRRIAVGLLVTALRGDAVADPDRYTVPSLIANLVPIALPFYLHWIVGERVKHMGEAARSAPSYFSTYYGLAALVLLTLGGLPCLKAIRKHEHLESLPAPRDPHPEPLQ